MSFFRGLNCCLHLSRRLGSNKCADPTSSLPIPSLPVQPFCEPCGRRADSEPHDGIGVLSIHTPGSVEVECGNYMGLSTSSTCLRRVPGSNSKLLQRKLTTPPQSLGSVYLLLGNWGKFCAPGDTWQCLEIFSVVTTQGWGHSLLASRG